MRLIDADETKETMKKAVIHHICTNTLYNTIMAVFDEATTVDAVEVVRCKDCKHYEKHTKWSSCTYWSGNPYEQAGVEDNDYCSYGERREE